MRRRLVVFASAVVFAAFCSAVIPGSPGTPAGESAPAPAQHPGGSGKAPATPPSRRPAPPNPKLAKLPFAFGGERMENTPVVFKDLITWELSPTVAPMLDPVPGEGINDTDADLFEFEGSTYIYYATGDQATRGTIRAAMYGGSMKDMLEDHFPGGVPMARFDAGERRYVYPE